jgi:MFS family permease
LNLLMFRAPVPRRRGITVVVFYAWHDLFAGILISQYFLATNALLDPRSAKRAYPWIVAAGSVGAAIGGAVTGLVAPRIGRGQPAAHRGGADPRVRRRLAAW